ncbi:MAG: FG-GAP repeat domain-containing protein, partial [Pirellulales bacterium]
ERDLPKLALVYGEEDWFKFETGSTGPLSVSATLAAAGPNVRLELYNLQAGNLHLVAAGTENGLATSVALSSSASATYWVRVLSGDDAQLNTSVRYTLSIKSLTDNLGTRAFGAVPGQTLEIGDDFHYALTSAAAGSFHVALTRAANFAGEIHLELLDPATLDVIFEGTLVGDELVADAAVTRGQKVYVHIYGDEDSHGSFDLSFKNLDQFSLEDISTVFYPTGLGPSESALADLNGDGAVDIVVSHVGQNILSVLMNNGDGTYQAPRELTIGAFQQGGPFTIQGIQNFHRDLAIANFNPPGPGRVGDNFLDIVVVNTSSSDISVLLGNGDGTFQPQRRFDATAAPYAMAVGDLNNDLIPDVVVIDSTSDPTAQGAVLLSRGDGTFQLPKPFSLPDREPNRTNSILIVDVNRDGKNDLVERDFISGTTIFLGNGDGTFQLNAESIIGASGPGLAVADLDGDGDLDVVTTQNNTSNVVYVLQNPDGTFEAEPWVQEVGQFPAAVQVVDVASVIEVDGEKVAVFGTPDGLPDLVVANNGYTLPTLSGPANVVVMAGLKRNGAFDGFTDPVEIAPAKGPLDVKVADINGDAPDDKPDDIVLLDRDGVLIAFGKKPIIVPNTTPATARDLGTVVHTIQPTLTIVPGYTEDYYKLTVPTEAFAGARDQVLDFSAGFAYEEGAGLMMQILDAAGNVLAAGDRVRVVAAQGEELFVRIFAAATEAAGAYTLIVNTLPQVAAIEAQSLLPGVGGLPGGPTTSLVVVFQGDRLNVAAAENKENYSVLWLGPDGVLGGGDDDPIKIGDGLPQDAKSVLYDPSRNNVDAASGRSIPTALRQTVTLLFGEPLPAGNYLIEVDETVMSSTFNVEELAQLSPAAGFHGHPVVSVEGGEVTEGVSRTRQNLVRPTGALGDLNELEDGTNFLTQSHNDLGALLDSLLTALGDDPEITDRLLQQIIAIVLPGLLGPNGEPIVPLAVIPIDPTSIGLVAPDGASLTHDLRTNTLTSNLPQTFIEVGGNLELIVIANPVGNYELTLADVPARARAGVVYFGRQGAEHDTFTDALRAKTLSTTFVADGFSLNVRYAASIAAKAADAAPTFVAFVAPQFVPRLVSTSIITSTSSLNAVAPSLLLSVANRSKYILGGNNLLKTFGSGGSLTRSLFRAAEDVWDLVFSGWAPVRQLLGDTPLGDELLEDSATPDGRDSGIKGALERAWESFGDMIDEILTPPENTDAVDSDDPQTSRSQSSQNERHQAQSSDAPPSDSQSNAGSGNSVNSGVAPIAPASAAPLPVSETTDAAPSSPEGPTHATAA